ncbi:MAG: GFA family protein [Parvularculaceae bacterium]
MTAAHGFSGGCQCGAVRYRVEGALTNAHVCYCRMCQKAAGNYFMPLANAQKRDFKVTRGEIAWFSSSDRVRRGFCRECGTPLIFETLAAKHLNVTLGSLDRPADVQPKTQDGVEGKVSWFDGLIALPSIRADADPTLANHQHPDHDTEDWPPDA